MNVKSTLEFVVTPSIIAVIITAISNFLINKRNNVYAYLVGHNKEYCENMRKLILEIEGSKNDSEIREKLSEVKIWLNPYNKFGDFSDGRDKQVWELIEEIEKDKKCTKKNKSRLIFTLQLLLQMKQDEIRQYINGSKWSYGLVFTGIIGLYFAVYVHFVKYEKTFDEYFIVMLTFLLLLPFILVILNNTWNENKVKRISMSDSNNKEHEWIENNSKLIAGYVATVVMLVVYAYSLSMHYDISIYKIKDEGLVTWIMISIWISVYFFSNAMFKNDIYARYSKTLKAFWEKDNIGNDKNDCH